MSAPARWLPAAALLLGGCESHVTVDLTDGPTDGVQEVVLDITHVALQTADGDIVRFALEDPGPVDVLALRNGATFRLVRERTIDPDRFVGLALDFAATGSFATRDDGGEVTINPPAARVFADLDLTVGEGESERLVLDLNLRFSLVDNGSGTYDLAPVVRAVRPFETGTVTGVVAATFVESTGCQAGRAAGTGVAVYAFEGTGVTPNDYTGQANLIDADDVELDLASSEYRYDLHFLPAGDYTLALTCQADADDPTSDDAVTFDSTADVSVPASSTVQLNFL